LSGFESGSYTCYTTTLPLESQATNLFCFTLSFKKGLLLLCKLARDHNLPTSATWVGGTTGVFHNTQLVSEIGSCCLPRLDLSHYPPISVSQAGRMQAWTITSSLYLLSFRPFSWFLPSEIFYYTQFKRMTHSSMFPHSWFSLAFLFMSRTYIFCSFPFVDIFLHVCKSNNEDCTYFSSYGVFFHTLDIPVPTPSLTDNLNKIYTQKSHFWLLHLNSVCFILAIHKIITVQLKTISLTFMSRAINSVFPKQLFEWVNEDINQV
jgi:hypothetical protein